MLIAHTADRFQGSPSVRILVHHLVHRMDRNHFQPSNCMRYQWTPMKQSNGENTSRNGLQLIRNCWRNKYDLFEFGVECTLNDASGVEPGCVDIIPLNRGTRQVLTWLYSLHTDIKNNSESLTLVTGLWCTVNVWNNCGLWPTVSGCWTMTRTLPDLVP